MKILNPFFATSLFLLSAVFANAQWSAARFDGANTFTKVFMATENTVFAIGTEPVNSEYFILRTNDAGVTWDSILVNNLTDTFQLSELFFVDMNTGFIGGTRNNSQVLLKTTDNGNMWTDITPAPFSLNQIVSVYFTDTQNGFAADGTNLYSTANGGTSWSSVTPSFSIKDLSFINTNNGFAAGTGSSGNGVVMVTSDGGQTWNTSLDVSDPNLFVSNFSKLDFVNPDTGFTFLENTNKLYRTLDGGISWDTIVADSVQYINDIDFRSADNGHMLTMSGQIYATEDAGQSWTLEYATEWSLYGPLVNLLSISFIEERGFVSGTKGLIKKHTAHAGTGIREEKLSGTVSVYPNPTTGKFTVLSLELSEAKSVHLSESASGTTSGGFKAESMEVFNVLGEKVSEQWSIVNGNSTNVQSQMTIDLSDHPSGIYFIQIKTKDEVVTRKVVKE